MICKTVGRSEQQKEEEKDMAEDYRNQAIGVFELESEANIDISRVLFLCYTDI